MEFRGKLEDFAAHEREHLQKNRALESVLREAMLRGPFKPKIDDTEKPAS